MGDPCHRQALRAHPRQATSYRDVRVEQILVNSRPDLPRERIGHGHEIKPCRFEVADAAAMSLLQGFDPPQECGTTSLRGWLVGR